MTSAVISWATLLAEPVAPELSASAGLRVQGGNTAEILHFCCNSQCLEDFSVKQ